MVHDIKINKSPHQTAFLLLIVFGVITLLFSVLFTKEQSFLFLNTYHTRFLDTAFQYATFMGDGIFALLVSVLLFLLGKRQLAFQILIVFLFSGLLAQLFKHMFAMPRPKMIISSAMYHHFISGVTHSGNNSFPSGHATTAFSLATMFMLNCKSPARQAIFVLLAVLVGYSRIYLGQHFLPDIFAGYVLGSGCAAVVCQYVTVPGFKKRSLYQISEFNIE